VPDSIKQSPGKKQKKMGNALSKMQEALKALVDDVNQETYGYNTLYTLLDVKQHVESNKHTEGIAGF